MFLSILIEKIQDLKLYEFGKSYHKIDGEYVENQHLIILLTGNIYSEIGIVQKLK